MREFPDIKYNLPLRSLLSPLWWLRLPSLHVFPLDELTRILRKSEAVGLGVKQKLGRDKIRSTLREKRKVKRLLRFYSKTGHHTHMKHHAWQEKVPTLSETVSCGTCRRQKPEGVSRFWTSTCSDTVLAPTFTGCKLLSYRASETLEIGFGQKSLGCSEFISLLAQERMN